MSSHSNSQIHYFGNVKVGQSYFESVQYFKITATSSSQDDIRQAVDYLKVELGRTGTEGMILDIPENYCDAIDTLEFFAGEVPMQFTVYSGIPNPQKIDDLPKGDLNRDHLCHSEIFNLNDISKFEKSITNIDRTPWLRHLIHDKVGLLPDAVSLTLTQSIKADFAGFAAFRKADDSEYSTLGPFLGINYECAQLLLKAMLLSYRPGRDQGFKVTTPVSNENAKRLFEYVQLEYSETINRYVKLPDNLFCKKYKNIKWNMIYGISDDHLQFV